MEANKKTITNSFGLLILRLGIGTLMALHGWGKLQMLLDGNVDKFGDPIGLGKQLSLISVVSAEFVCAILVAVGLFTRLAAAPVVFTMGVAIFVVHANDPWMMGGGPSKEPALLFLIPFLALIFTGPGRFSIDELIWPRLRAKREAAAPAENN